MAEVGEVQQEGLSAEDEVVASVKDVVIDGKFPQGLIIQGKKFADPGPWSRDYTLFSTSSWRPTLTKEGLLMQGFLMEIKLNPDLVTTGLLFYYPDEKNPDEDSIISFALPVDIDIRDVVGRPAGGVIIGMRLPKDKARTLVGKVITDDRGGDIAEEFLRKVLGEQSGIERAKTTRLALIDNDNVDKLFPNGGFRYVQPERILTNAVIKEYSKPIGNGRSMAGSLNRSL